VLQQNALSPNDAFCTAGKAAALLDLVLAVGDRCREIVNAGTPAETVEALDFGPIVRARDETGPDEADAVVARREEILARLREP
jgi:V/A-type H+/Na+-transporting ATPase subunit A